MCTKTRHLVPSLQLIMKNPHPPVERHIETFTADLEAPLHALVRSYLRLSSTTKSRNLIKGGAVRVDGHVLKNPSDVIPEGTQVSVDTGARTEKGDDTREASVRKGAENFPFDILYEDPDMFCYLKPAGWVSASPNPRVDTTFTRAKDYLLAQDSINGRPARDVHFVNLIEKEISGIGVVVRDMNLRKRLQENWSRFNAGSYVLVQGDPEPDGEFSERRESDRRDSGRRDFGDKKGGDRNQRDDRRDDRRDERRDERDGERRTALRKFPYRTMRSGSGYVLLKVNCALEDVRNILPGLRSMGCLVIGLGDNAPNPIGRKGLHSFSLELEDEVMDARWEIKTRVPKEFLTLVR